MKNRQFKQLEELLYSYKELPFKRKVLELGLRLEDDPEKRYKLEKVDADIKKIDNILEMLKTSSEKDYLIIKLRYIEGLTWTEIQSQLNMTQSYLIKCRKKLFEEKLLTMS